MTVIKKILKKIRKTALAVLRYFPRMRWWARKTYWNLRHLQYESISNKVVIEQKTVLFESYSGRSYACSPWAIFEALCADQRFDDWQFYWSLRESKIEDLKSEYSLLVNRATPVIRGSRQYYEACAKAASWVINNRMPEWVHPRRGQVYVQCWHGTPLKRLGFDLPEAAVAALNTATELSWRFQIDAQKWTYLLSPSAYCSKHLLSAFGVTSEAGCTVLEQGYPRNDAIVNTMGSGNIDQIAEAIRQRLGIPHNKRVLLYTPTWRDSEYKTGLGYVIKNELDFELLQKRIGKEWIILLRTHYYISNRIDLSSLDGFVFDASAVNDVNDLYIVADVLVTDYSSALFDYSNTSRPLILFWPDYEFYRSELHGFYMDPNEIPGPKCVNTEEVAAAVESQDLWFAQYGEDYEKFRQRFCPMDDGLAAKRVIEQVFSP